MMPNGTIAKRARRILSVDATAFTLSTDMGILKTHVFSGWPKEDLAQLILGNDVSAEAYCGPQWRITRHSLSARPRGGPLLPDLRQMTAPSSSGQTASAALRRMRREWIQPARNAVADVVMSRVDYGSEPRLLEWAERFGPDAIFTFGASAAICKAAVSLAEALRVPIVPYFTDDWPSRLYCEFPWNVALRGTLLNWLDRMLARSPVALTICDLMAAEYSERFGGKFMSCVDSVDLGRYPLDVLPRTDGGSVTFSYMGVLAPRRWEILRLVAHAIENLRNRGLKCRFHIYAPPADVETYSSLLNLSEEVRIVGTLPYSEVPAAQMKSDVLVHAEAFLEGLSLARTRLSLSTKIPQYLAAGRPVLAVGPKNVASMEYLSRTGAAMLVGSSSYEEIVSNVERMARDATLRASMGRAGRVFCEKHHTRDAMTARFSAVVEEAITSMQVPST